MSRPQSLPSKAGAKWRLPVLAATLTTVVVFFPVTLLYGVSKFLFSSLALAVVLSLFASYAVAMTVVPLFCARFMKASAHAETQTKKGLGARFNVWFNRGFDRFLDLYNRSVSLAVARPAVTLGLFACVFFASLLIAPLLGFAFFPMTDAGQFVMRVKSPSGTRLEETENDIKKLEALIRQDRP